MADVTITIPPAQEQRFIDAYKGMLQEGDAQDLENPTNQEMIAFFEKLTRQYHKGLLRNREKIIHDESLNFEDPNLE